MGKAMTDKVEFRTSEECLLKLVAHTMMVMEDEEDDAPQSRCAASWLPVHAARASFGKENKTGVDPAADTKLMFLLSREGHTSVFEHQSATFLIECPLFIRSQIMRHRTFSYNEISRRYTSEQLGFWKPTTYRKQAAKNKQCSEGKLVPTASAWADWRYTSTVVKSLDEYHGLLTEGVCREQARAVLPQSLLTRFYMTGNLRNWSHFLKLRLDSHAQPEVQIIAQRIEAELRKLWPLPMDALMETTNAID